MNRISRFLKLLSLMAGTSLSAGEAVPLHEQIDRLMTKDWAAAKITPAVTSTDADFFRRLNLDLHGLIPTPAETKAFLDDRRTDKRSRAIDALLARPEYALHMARVFDVSMQ